MTGRSVPEWIGTDADTPVPPRVKLRVFERDNGICQLCSRKIRPGDQWVTDHTLALTNGGANREANLQTICSWCDRNIKTPADVAEKSRIYKRRLNAVGIERKKSRPMPGSRQSPWKAKVGGGWVRRDEA
ncbi:HNH endonuclease [Rhodoligotrophos ferricapiens]|uniref:HNH endonuclease n=1 Tax=Rhodoligotrophos ferricapiens TaxID=3069264 RepID=UPI00315CDD71